MTSLSLLKYAEETMNRIDPKLTRQFVLIVRFLSENPTSANYLGNESEISSEYVSKFAESFKNSRELRKPSTPNTKPDPMVGIILSEHFGIDRELVETAINHHLYAMGAENIIGHLLEMYIAEKLEPLGWAWCSSPYVKSVDFIKRGNAKNPWILLQVKNRDNTENSSSVTVRKGTKIDKWFRTRAKTGETNWSAFPDKGAATKLSEQGFRDFVRDYLKKLKTK